jgi:hypothetical protein
VDNKQDPVMYRLKDLKGEIIRGEFYEEEMQLTKLKDFAVIDKILKTKKTKYLAYNYFMRPSPTTCPTPMRPCRISP